MKIKTKEFLIIALCIILLTLFIMSNIYFNKADVYAKEDEKVENNVEISNASEVNLDDIINNNTNNGQKVEYETEEMDLEYITKYKQNSALATGTIQVIQEGRNGKQEITKKITYENGAIVSEQQLSSKITKASVDKIVEIGTGSKKSNHQIKVGDIVYVSSDRANIMFEPNENSKKVATLAKDAELKILEIQDGWYKISGQGATGYIKIENTVYKGKDDEETPKTKPNTNTTNNKSNESKGKNIEKPSMDMALNKPSGLSLEQFNKVLTDSKDKNNIFKDNAQYFYYVEEEYNINGIFVAAVGIHESNWGTSKIARDKHNLFGYGAYDSNPYNGAYNFENYSECIDLISRVFVKYYLNPKGTKIYGNEVASGKYYSGSDVTSINKKYATDKNWAKNVYKNIEYLYNKL